MLSGKATQRSIRGHMLVDSVLTLLHLEGVLLCLAILLCLADGNNNNALSNNELHATQFENCKFLLSQGQ
jgi:hypothetical protein